METDTKHNVEKIERVMSVLSGAAMLYNEFKKEDTSKIKLGIAAFLIYRGLSGNCAVSSLTGLNSSALSGLSRFL